MQELKGKFSSVAKILKKDKLASVGNNDYCDSESRVHELTDLRKEFYSET